MGSGKQASRTSAPLSVTPQSSLFPPDRKTGCTPKALTHRLAKIRNLAKAEHTDVAAPEAKTTSTIKQSSKVKARGGETKKTAGGRKKTACMPPDDEDDAELIHGGAAPTPPPSDRPKRRVSKRDYAQLADEDEDEDDDENGDATNQLTKKVKIEVGEDIGEGLRQTNEEGLEN